MTQDTWIALNGKRVVTPGLNWYELYQLTHIWVCRWAAITYCEESPGVTVQSVCSCVSEPPDCLLSFPLSLSLTLLQSLTLSVSHSHTHCVILKNVQVRGEGSVILPPHPLEQYLIVDTVSVDCVCFWLRKLLVCLCEHPSAIHKLPTGQSNYSHEGPAAVSPDVGLTCRTWRRGCSRCRGVFWDVLCGWQLEKTQRRWCS